MSSFSVKSTRDLATAAYLHMREVPVVSARRGSGNGFSFAFRCEQFAFQDLRGEYINSECVRFDSSVRTVKRLAQSQCVTDMAGCEIVDVDEAAYLHMRGVDVVAARSRRGKMEFGFQDTTEFRDLRLAYANSECCRFYASLVALKRMCSDCRRPT